LKNEKSKRKNLLVKVEKPFYQLALHATPQDALLRIEDDLDQVAFPPPSMT
jgi:hypothetical protein